MKVFRVVLLLLLTVSCGEGKQPLSGNTDYQKERNATFKDATKSPLSEKDRKHFKGLDFFDFDSSFVITASLERKPESEWFNMKTTTSRLSKERVYGILTFKLDGKEYMLKVYQGEENMNTEGFEDYLFLPFLDKTNGSETYAGGRYIDLRIPNGNSIEIDFNKAYNPYCVYNEKYSCPIVPRENYLDIDVSAGEKNYLK